MTGIVKWFDDAKGHGFIAAGDSARDFFIHFSDLIQGEGRKTLTAGQVVESGSSVGSHARPYADDAIGWRNRSRPQDVRPARSNSAGGTGQGGCARAAGAPGRINRKPVAV